jgi:dTDP-4-amino-4,6-dideoxygalactose transaminase
VHWVVAVDHAVGRDRLAAALAAEGVQTKPYYERLRDLREPAAAPVAWSLYERALALPMSSELCRDDAERVAVATRRALRGLRTAGGDGAPTIAGAGRGRAPLRTS